MDPVTATTVATAPKWVPLAAAGGGALISALGSMWASNRGAQSAKEQMKFQERMSNTSHQREVADLRLAGLNPIMSANKGASTPSGTQFTPENPMKDTASHALNAVIAKQQSSLLDAQIQKTYADAYVSGNTSQKIKQDMEIQNKLLPYNLANSAVQLKQLLNTTDIQDIDKILKNLSVNEAQSSSRLYGQIGESGKAYQLLLPMLLKLMGK